MTKEQIIENLPNINILDLKEIRDKIDFFIHWNSKKREDITIYILYGVLTNKIEKLTGQKPVELYILKKTAKPVYKLLIETHDNIISYGQKLLGRTPNRFEILKLFNLYIKVIINTYQENNLNFPLNLTTIFNMGKNFPTLLERAFPGYSHIALNFIN
jgi:hypothetical protein